MATLDIPEHTAEHPTTTVPRANTWWVFCYSCQREIGPWTGPVEQPAPVPNTSRPVWEMVIEDMQARDAHGRAEYGTPLQANNGRDMLVDAYLEVLDLAVYLRGAIEERHAPAVDDWKVHNHGTEEGRGVACREYHLNGRLVGACKIIEATGHG